jgi:Ca-activated chloride channel homolog
MFQGLKIGLFLFFITQTQLSFGQEWKELALKAREAYRSGEYELALQLYDKLDKIKPKEIDFSDEMGQTYYKLNDFEKATKCFQKARENQLSREAEARNSYNEGNSFFKQQKFQEAIEAYKKSLRINPQDEKARYNLSEALRKLNPESPKDEDKNNQNKPKEQPKENKPQENNQPQQKEEDDDSKDESSKSNKLPKDMVDRHLDQLSKKEMETKKKLNKQKGTEGMISSGKDW